MIKGHYTKAELIGDVTIPGAHSLSFLDPDTLYVSTVIGHTQPITGGVVSCTEDLKHQPFFSNQCSYYCVATRPQGGVAVRNGTGNSIEIYSEEGHKAVEWDLPAGKHKGMAIDGQGQVYVCDAQSDCIRVYDSTGELQRVIKHRDLKIPHYIALSESGLAVTCMGDEPALVYMNSAGEVLWTCDDFEWPAGVAVDSNNDLYVCDVEEKKVVMLTNDGELSFDMISGDMLSHQKPFAVAVKGNRLAVQLLDSDTVKLFKLTS